jgi:hypothetical protein
MLYSISETGTMRKANNLELVQNRVYLVDDIKTIYIWYGIKASSKKKDSGIKKAKAINSKRKKPADIQIINQNEEYGSFLAIIDLLKEGKFPTERRKELKIKYEDTIELIEAGLDPDLEGEITVAAHDLAEEKKTYEELCKELAKIQLTLMKEKGKPNQKEINEKAEEIHKSSSTYNEICWLIAEMRTLVKRQTV